MKAADLGLIDGPAKDAAEALEAACPWTIFTSGRRYASDQARAMAQNIVHRRDWIARTYRATAASAALQHWVDQHPEAVRASDIEAGLLSIINTWDAAMRRLLSFHFSGEGFDVQPMIGTEGEAILALLRARPDIKFLEHEGGLIRWHVQAAA